MDYVIITDSKEADNLPWKPIKDPGCFVKVLGRHPDSEAIGGYFKMEPNSEAVAHSHPSDEFSLVLEGEIELDGKIYGPGTYFHRPAGVVHGTHKTGEKGVLIFACFAGPSGSEKVLELTSEE